MADGSREISRLFGLESDDLKRQFTARREQLDRQLDRGEVVKAEIREVRRIGRNDPCPCGSGTKFKKCCGARLSPTDDRVG